MKTLSMPRNFLKKLLPHQNKLLQYQKLSRFERVLSSPYLWHINRQSISKAMAIGLLIAFIPIPFQMLAALACAFMFQANVALSIALVWITNPFTIPPIIYLAYKIGNLVLMHTPEKVFALKGWGQWFAEIASLWQPIIIGLILLGLTCSIVGYIITQFLWKLYIIRKWQKRIKTRTE